MFRFAKRCASSPEWIRLKTSFEIMLSSRVARKVEVLRVRIVSRMVWAGRARRRESFSEMGVEMEISSFADSSSNWPVARINMETGEGNLL